MHSETLLQVFLHTQVFLFVFERVKQMLLYLIHSRRNLVTSKIAAAATNLSMATSRPCAAPPSPNDWLTWRNRRAILHFGKSHHAWLSHYFHLKQLIGACCFLASCDIAKNHPSETDVNIRKEGFALVLLDWSCLYMYKWMCNKELGSDTPKWIFHRGEPRKKICRWE